jgi:hypothetical protein
MNTPNRLADDLKGALGALVGGTLGYYTFGLLVRQGFYAMMIPGALMGLGCSLVARDASKARGVACAVAALALGIFAEWRFFPFNADPSLGFFLAHLGDLSGLTMLMIVAGAGFAYGLGGSGAGGRSGPVA